MYGWILLPLAKPPHQASKVTLRQLWWSANRFCTQWVKASLTKPLRSKGLNRNCRSYANSRRIYQGWSYGSRKRLQLQACITTTIFLRVFLLICTVEAYVSRRALLNSISLTLCSRFRTPTGLNQKLSTHSTCPCKVTLSRGLNFKCPWLLRCLTQMQAT